MRRCRIATSNASSELLLVAAVLCVTVEFFGFRAARVVAAGFVAEVSFSSPEGSMMAAKATLLRP